MCVNLREEQYTDADIPEHSKREYLLAQIRQKDAIIESLLKQVWIKYLMICLALINPSGLAAQPLSSHAFIHRVVPDGNISLRSE